MPTSHSDSGTDKSWREEFLWDGVPSLNPTKRTLNTMGGQNAMHTIPILPKMTSIFLPTPLCNLDLLWYGMVKPEIAIQV